MQSSQAERRDHEPGVHAEDRQQEGDRAEPRLPEPPRVHLQPAQGVQIRDNGGKQEEIRRTGPESLIKIKNLLNANDTLILYKYNIVKKGKLYCISGKFLLNNFPIISVDYIGGGVTTITISFDFWQHQVKI